MIQFIIPILLTALMFLEKLYFLTKENNYLGSIWGKIDILIFGFVLISGIFTFIFTKKYKTAKVKKSNNSLSLLSAIFLLGTLIAIFTSFQLNFSKVSVNWDAIALYDARAKFLASGMKFSDMPLLAEYDNLNKYYYLLYPPYTSIAHFFWENSLFLKNVPVGVYYSVVLFVFILFVFLVSYEYFGLTAASIISFLISSNSSIFNIAIKEYTNLPFSLYLVTGTLLIFSYLKNNQTWKFLIGSLLIATSCWIRFLEPMWLVILVSLFTSLLLKKQLFKRFILPIFLGVLCAVSYSSWNYFVIYVGKSPAIVSFSWLTILEPLVGVLTGAWISVMFFFMKSWGVPLLVSILALVSAMLSWQKIYENIEMVFLTLVIFFSIVLYYSQLYFVSFQADWWKAAAGSLDRSATFLIPISAFVLIYVLVNSRLFPTANKYVKKTTTYKK